MISEKSITALCALAGIEAEVFNTALKADDSQDIDIVKTNSFSDEDLTTLKENVKKDNQGDYEGAKKAGEEMRMKALSEKAGLETIKDMDTFLDTFKTSILKDAGKEPEGEMKKLTDKVRDLNVDNEKLRGTITENESKMESSESSYQSKLSNLDINTKLSELIKGELGSFSKTEYVDLYRKNNELVNDEGKIILKQNGEVVKDNKQSPVDPYTHFQDWLKEKGIEEKGTGRGGGNSESSFSDLSSIKNREDLNKHFEEKGIDDFNEKQEILLEVQKNDSYTH